MTPRAIALILVWGGLALLAGLLVYRVRRGAWSLEDDDIPHAGPVQRALMALGLAVSALGAGLFVWSLMDHGVG